MKLSVVIGPAPDVGQLSQLARSCREKLSAVLHADGEPSLLSGDDPDALPYEVLALVAADQSAVQLEGATAVLLPAGPFDAFTATQSALASCSGQWVIVLAPGLGPDALEPLLRAPESPPVAFAPAPRPWGARLTRALGTGFLMFLGGRHEPPQAALGAVRLPGPASRALRRLAPGAGWDLPLALAALDREYQVLSPLAGPAVKLPKRASSLHSLGRLGGFQSLGGAVALAVYSLGTTAAIIAPRKAWAPISGATLAIAATAWLILAILGWRVRRPVVRALSALEPLTTPAAVGPANTLRNPGVGDVPGAVPSASGPGGHLLTAPPEAQRPGEMTPAAHPGSPVATEPMLAPLVTDSGVPAELLDPGFSVAGSPVAGSPDAGGLVPSPERIEVSSPPLAKQTLLGIAAPIPAPPDSLTTPTLTPGAPAPISTGAAAAPLIPEPPGLPGLPGPRGEDDEGGSSPR